MTEVSPDIDQRESGLGAGGLRIDDVDARPNDLRERFTALGRREHGSESECARQLASIVHKVEY